MLFLRFLLVSLAVDAILAEATIHWRRQTLYTVANGFGLEYAYSMTLARIRDQGPNRSKLGMDALMWVCRSERPLGADELCHALGVGMKGKDFSTHNVPSIRTILGSTLGLITIDETTSTVRLIHFTLQEYLGELPTLFVAPHSSMAEVCLTYLNSRYIRELSPTLDIDPRAAHFLEYSACFWATHATMDVTESVKSQALQLLDGYENHVSANILLREKRPLYVAQGHVEGFTGLHCVAFLGMAEIARSMVATKIWDLNRRDSKASTPLLWAVTYGNEEVVGLLLEQGDTNPNVADEHGRTPLSFATDLGREDMVKLLLERGDVKPDLPDREGRTPLSFAAGWGREDIVKLLLERRDVKPDLPDNQGRTPLSFAAGWGREGIVKLLLERGDVKPDLPDSEGRTPLSFAAELGREGIVKLLLKRGDVKPDLQDSEGRTSLSFAAEWGREGIVKLLLECPGINPSSSDNAGRTPLSLASERRREVVVKLLKEWLDRNPSPSDTKNQSQLPIPTMNSDGGAAKQISEPRNPNQELTNKNHGRTPPSAQGKNTQKPKTPFLLPEQENVTLPTADNPDAAATCTISRSTLTTSLRKRPAPPLRPKNSRPKQPDPPPPISLLLVGVFGLFMLLILVLPPPS